MPLSTVLLLIIAVLVVAVLGVGFMLLRDAHRKDIQERERRRREIQKGAERFAERAERGLEPISVKLLLRNDEHGLLEEQATLFETRAYRVYGGGGTRIGRVFVGGGASESHQRLKEIDTGTLTLTTRRLVFDGTHENRTLKVADVLSVNPWSDAIEVSTQRRAKSQVFTVSNPLIWASAVHAVAAGKFRERRTEDNGRYDAAQEGEGSEERL